VSLNVGPAEHALNDVRIEHKVGYDRVGVRIRLGYSWIGLGLVCVWVWHGLVKHSTLTVLSACSN